MEGQGFVDRRRNSRGALFSFGIPTFGIFFPLKKKFIYLFIFFFNGGGFRDVVWIFARGTLLSKSKRKKERELHHHIVATFIKREKENNPPSPASGAPPCVCLYPPPLASSPRAPQKLLDAVYWLALVNFVEWYINPTYRVAGRCLKRERVRIHTHIYSLSLSVFSCSYRL